MSKTSVVFEDSETGGYSVKLLLEYDGNNSLSPAEIAASNFYGLIAKVHAGLVADEQKECE